MPPRRSTGDFDPDSMVQSDQYERDREQLKEKLGSLEERVGDNVKLAATLKAVSDETRVIDEIIKSSFINLLANNTEVREAVKKFMDTYERNRFFTTINRFQALLYGVLGFIILRLLELLINAFKITPK